MSSAPDDNVKEAIKAFMQLTLTVTEKQAEIKFLKTQMAAAKVIVQQYMQQNDIQQCRLQDGSEVQYRKKTVVSPVSIGVVQTALSERMNEDDDIAEILQLIKQNRKQRVVEELKLKLAT